MKPFIVFPSDSFKMCALLHFSGFVHGEAGAEPRLIQFHPHFQHGALLTVVSAFTIYGHTYSTVSFESFCVVTESGCLSFPLPVLVQWKDLSFAFLLCECWSFSA